MRSSFYFVLLLSCMKSAESGICREVGCDNYLFSDDAQCDPCTEEVCCALQTCAEAKSMGCFDEFPTGVVTCENQLCGPDECCVEPGQCAVDFGDCGIGSVPISGGVCGIECNFNDCCEDISCKSTFPTGCGLPVLNFVSGVTCTGTDRECLVEDCCIPDPGCFHTREEAESNCPNKVRTNLINHSGVSFSHQAWCCNEETCSGFGAPTTCPSGTEKNEDLVCGGFGGIDCTIETCCFLTGTGEFGGGFN